jgi:hypothetical protein
MKIAIELYGTQTDTHCSMTSSINACNKLDTKGSKCLLFHNYLEYDGDAHAYKRCQQCINAELKGDNKIK